MNTGPATTAAEPLHRTRILVIEDNAAEARLAREWLVDDGFPDVQVVRRLADALEVLSGERHFDAITVDLALPDSTGLATFRAVHAAAPDTPAIVVSGLADKEVALAAVREGAQDYLMKRGMTPDAFPRTVRYAIERRRLLDESRRLEAKLEQAQRLEALGTMAGGIAHDFNNLLTAMIGYYELLKEQLAGNSKATDDLEEIGRAARVAATLTGQLLAFARSEPLRKETLDINGLVRGFQGTLQGILGDGVTVQLTLADGPVMVEADPGELRQVLLNLAANARDAMSGSGTFIIETAAATQARDETHQLARIRISDTGRGMDAATQARIFDPFFTTKGVGKGSGLGLATVHGIIAHTGGTISVVSAAGAGTSFVIELPSRPASGAPQRAAKADQATAAPAVIFLIEDEDAVRRLMTTALVRANFDVIAAASAGEAVRIAATETRSPALIITDVVLPDGRGTAIIPGLKKQWPHARIVLMSGYTDAALADDLEIDGFLPKPFLPTDVTTVVRRVLGGAVPPEQT